MKKKQGMMIGFAVLLITALFTMAGCEDPVTGKTNLTGSVKIINEYSGEISVFYVHENGGQFGGDKVWDAYPKYLDYGNSKVISSGGSMTFYDIPAGTWHINVRSVHLNDVVISAGMTTTVILDSAGNLTAGVPLP